MRESLKGKRGNKFKGEREREMGGGGGGGGDRDHLLLHLLVPVPWSRSEPVELLSVAYAPNPGHSACPAEKRK